MFDCKRCGCCCRNLDKSKLYASMDRGDGVCIYLKGNDCSIYENRPLLCRIDASYELMFKNFMTKEDYYCINKGACEKIKRMRKTEE